MHHRERRGTDWKEDSVGPTLGAEGGGERDMERAWKPLPQSLSIAVPAYGFHFTPCSSRGEQLGDPGPGDPLLLSPTSLSSSRCPPM